MGVLHVPGHEEAEDVDGGVQNQKTEGGQAEAHDATRAEGGVETVRPGDLAHGGGTGVGVHGNGHTDVAAEDGGQATDHEGNAGKKTVGNAGAGILDDPLAAVQRRILAAIRAVEDRLGDAAGLGQANEAEDHDTEDDNEDEQDLVLSPQEGLGTVGNVSLDLVQALRDGLVVGGRTALRLDQTLLTIARLGNVLHPTHHADVRALYTTLATLHL